MSWTLLICYLLTLFLLHTERRKLLIAPISESNKKVQLSLGHETHLKPCLFLMYMCVIIFRITLENKAALLETSSVMLCRKQPWCPEGCQSLFHVNLEPEVADWAVWTVVKVMVAERKQKALFLKFLQIFCLPFFFFNFLEAQNFSKWMALLYKQHIMSTAFQQYLPTPPKHWVVFTSVWSAEPVGMQGFF